MGGWFLLRARPVPGESGHGGARDAQSPTTAGPGTQKSAWAILVLVLTLAPRAAGDPRAGRWPEFLAPPETFPAATAAAVRDVWDGATLSRSVRGRTARVPLDVYVAFVDTPDVTAAAARARDLARYEVQALGDGWYRADDRTGARGVYHVLVREGTRRVILSWGTHAGSILGTITGSALTLLDLEPRDGAVEQRLTAWVKIDSAVAAALARFFVAIFGHVADRKLAEGFAVTARVAEWALERPDQFCLWLDRAPVPAARRERVLAVLPACLDKSRSPRDTLE